MKSSFTIYTDRPIANRTKTHTEHTHISTTYSSGRFFQFYTGIIAFSHYSVPDLCLIQYSSVESVVLRPGRGGWVGQGGGVQRLMPSGWKQLQWTQKYWHPQPTLRLSPLSPGVYTGRSLQHATHPELRASLLGTATQSLYSPPLITWKTINKAPQ